MNGDVDKMAVVSIANNDYVKYADVLVKSFFHNNLWFDGDFIFLYDNFIIELSENNRRYLENLHPNIKCLYVSSNDFIDSANKLLRTMRHNRWVTALFKFQIFRMTEYNKILFLDADMLILNDIKPIFDLNIPIGMTSHCLSTVRGIYKKKKSDYLNTGLIYLGDNTYINDDTFNGISQLIKDIDYKKTYRLGWKKIKYFELPDQDVLNIYFLRKEGVYVLPQFYNAQFANRKWSYKNTNDPDWKISDEVILHYLCKPDNEKVKDYPVCKLWEYYRDNVKIKI